MENMENNVVLNEAAEAAVEVTNTVTVGQKVLGGFIGACTVVGAVVIAKKVAEGIKSLIGKVKTAKANKQAQETTVDLDSEDETK